MVLAILGIAGYYWASQNAKLSGGPVISVPTVTADSGSVVATIRINGTIAAKNQANILAPRLSGSRTDVNRGGAIGAGGGGRGFGGGGGGGNAGVMMGGGGGPQNDFSLILMKLKDPGARVKKGDTVAEFDPQMQNQRLDDYKDTQIQTQATIKSFDGQHGVAERVAHATGPAGAGQPGLRPARSEKEARSGGHRPKAGRSGGRAGASQLQAASL